MVAGIIAVPEIKSNCPERSKTAEQDEGAAPGHVLKHQDDQRRRERSTPPGRHPQNSLSPCTLRTRQPGTEGFRQIRKATSLTRTEKEPHNPERRVTPHVAG